ncbi:MAG: hypothetical protein E6H10_10925 [Bacteroidetes bacterium]|nr:MAG: hypothetical protein E6H10_10925 [Bacteroidota bacterium]
MATARTTIRIFFLCLFLLLQTNYFSFSQTSSFPIEEWVKKLGTKDGPAASGIVDVFTALAAADTTQVKATLDDVEARGDLKNNYFKARFFATKAKCTSRYLQIRYQSHEAIVTQMLKQALNAAYETNNDSLIAEVSWIYGEASYFYERTEPAAMYLLFAAELDERIGRQSTAYNCLLLGLSLYKTRDYRKSIHYTVASIKRETDTSAETKRLLLSRYNTVGLCYQRMGIYDSAFLYYDLAMKMANEVNITVWKAIISGNKGQVYYSQKNYGLAKPLLLFDYSISKAASEQSSAANSLQWVARINLAEGKKDSALMKIKEALDLLTQRSDQSSPYYRQNVYYAAADVYRAFAKEDSVYKYFDLYINLHDSIERSVADSRVEISRIKLDNLENALAIKNLQKEKEATQLRRNFILLAIVLVAVVAIFLLYRQRQKLAYKQRIAEAEGESARQQMELFRQSIIEKTNLIDKLQEQVQNRETTAEQIQIVDELSQQTILTEDDWDKFKKLFEKIYPGFFIKLKEKAIDITLAEQRMAALTRLHLTPKQMASMLGISPLSVHKTRQRLRQRLHITSESNLEETITSL